MQLHPKLIELLHKRGIETEEDIQEFLSDSPQKSYDPFLLLNMREGVDLILSAVNENKKICIYGDYDADGVTSTVILTEVLSHLTDNLMHYIPSRFGEGYGLNKPALKKIREEGAELLITVDTGTAAPEEVLYARELGMDVVITDHHTVPENPAPGILINPHQKTCPYPFSDLAGCGVAFKLAQALISAAGLPKRILTRTLDLVAIGTVADIVPLKDENRTLVKYGLRVINTGSRRSLQALMDAAHLHGRTVTAEQIAYIIGPHINAAGRVKHAEIAASLFLTEDEDLMRQRASELAECNALRKEQQQEVFEQAMQIVSERLSGDDFLVIDVQGNWEGVAGIAAGKIKELLYKPTVIVTKEANGMLKGTGRCIDGLNLFDLLNEQKEMFTTFGGHAAACGFTLKPEYLDEFRRNLNQRTRAIRAEHPEIFVKRIMPDLRLSAQDASLDLVHQMELLEPCGCENEQPMTAVEGRIEHVSHMGDRGQYLRFQAAMPEFHKLSCIAFHDVRRLEKEIQSTAGQPAEIVGRLQDDEWQGNHQLKMVVEDIHPPF
ncbi:single-stranded-DNA-specific exonuclease RecJ [Eubacterium sp. F2]|uniref:single-stranded-DNA-specific exonuclease RecJ n=1 Tax=Eubacterium sp. F2 TaxID=3381348 RepID=UPI003908422B